MRSEGAPVCLFPHVSDKHKQLTVEFAIALLRNLCVSCHVIANYIHSS